MMKLVLALVGVLFMAVGFEALDAEPWFGWIDVTLGVLAILSLPQASSARYLVPLGPLGVGAGAMLLCIGGVFSAAVPKALLWGTLGLGLFSLFLAAFTLVETATTTSRGGARTTTTSSSSSSRGSQNER